MKTFKEFLNEQMEHSDYSTSSEKSQFGGFVPIVKHKKRGHTLFSGGDRFEDAEIATAAARAYLDGYFTLGSPNDNTAKRMYSEFVRKNKSSLVVK